MPSPETSGGASEAEATLLSFCAVSEGGAALETLGFICSGDTLATLQLSGCHEAVAAQGASEAGT